MVPSGGFVVVNLASEALLFSLQRYKKIAKYASFPCIIFEGKWKFFRHILINASRWCRGWFLMFIRRWLRPDYELCTMNWTMHYELNYALWTELTWVRWICIILIFTQILNSDFLRISERGTSEMIFFITHNILE